MNLRKRTLGTLLGLAWLSMFASPVLAQYQDDHAEDGDEVQMVELAAVRQTPEAFINVPIRTAVYFHQFDKFYNPYYTFFDPDRFLNFSAWGEEQELWNRKEYKQDHTFFFMAKHSANLDKLLELKKYDRVILRGTVRTEFKGTPWIEIFDLEVDEEQNIAENDLIKLVRAKKLQGQGYFDQAIDGYQAAVREGLPTLYLGFIERELGNCHYYRGDFKSAQNHLAKALELRPKDRRVKERLQVTASLLERGAGNRTTSPVLPTGTPAAPRDN
ncbi:MAG: tetratricopeptide repeat protein [Planctomycetota bacterium]